MHHASSPRLAGFAALLLTAAGCASSTGGALARDTFYGTQVSLCLAAQSAIRDLGGRVTTSDCDSGILAGRLDVEGTFIQLDVTLIRSPGGDRSQSSGEYIDVSARASVVGLEDPDPAWSDRLRRILDEYMTLVRQRSATRR